MLGGFADRPEAGRRLAAALARFRGEDVLVLALPRGGVPVAAEIARELGGDLDVLVVRKIGAPGHEELGIGALVQGDETAPLINPAFADMVGATADYIEQARKREATEIARRKHVYRGDRTDPVVAGRTVVVVDDGIATGGTMMAALRSIRRRHPARLVMAVPVAPADALDAFAAECDEIVCLKRPDRFLAVGNHYADFHQVSDDEVVRLLAEGRAAPAASPAQGGTA